MKYILPQSRLEELIMKYLDAKLKNIEEHKSEIAGAPAHWWGVGLDEIFYVIPDSKGVNGLGISGEFVSSLERFFSIPFYEAQKYILRWAKNNLGIEPDFYQVD